MSEDKPDKEEVMALGRVTGALKKANPSLYKTVEELALQKGVKPWEILAEAVERYINEGDALSHMSAVELRASWDFFKDYADTIIKWFTDMYQKTIETTLEHTGNVYKMIAPETPQPKPDPLAELRANMLKSVAPIITSMMEMMIMNMIPAHLRGQPKAKVPITVVRKSDQSSTPSQQQNEPIKSEENKE